MSDEFDEEEDEEDSDSEDDEGGSNLYLLKEQDRGILNAAILLVEKLIRSKLIRPAQVVSVGKVLHVLRRLPFTSSPMEVYLSLSSREREFGPHKIMHSWTIEISEQSLGISSGGGFWRPSTGGDSFTCMRWRAYPGSPAEFSNYLYSLRIVDDAQPFDVEVAEIDFSEPGYTLRITDEDNPLLEEDEEVETEE